MNYDYLKRVDVNTYPNENIEVREKKTRKTREKKEKRERVKFTPFGIIVTQLSLGIAASLIYMLITVITKAEALGIADVFKDFFGNVNI
jgi:retron-type reverse transcriptase